MDILGKEGEKAQENIKHLSEELGKLESHLNAVDAALQDFVDRFQQLESDEQSFLRDELEQLESLADRDDEIEKLRKRVNNLEKRQQANDRKLEKLYDSGLMDTIETLRSAAKSSKKVSQGVRSDLRSLEERVDELEGNFLLEVNKRDYDFGQKLDVKEFEKEKDAIINEIKKLRASVNILADEIDEKDSINTG